MFNLYLIDMDVLIFDQFVWVEEYDALTQGQYTLSDLWEPYGGHRLPLYKLMFFLNCWLFGFSPQLESMMAIIPFTMAGVYMSHRFSEPLEYGKIVKFLVFLTFALIFFNAQTLRQTYYSVILTQLLDYAGFLIVVSLAFSLVFPENKESRLRKWLLFVLSVIVFILLLGRGYGVAASAAIIALCGFALLKSPKNKNAWIIGTILTGAIFIYMYGLAGSDSVSKGFNLQRLLKFMAIKLGNSNIGMFVYTTRTSASEFYSIVVGVFLFLVSALIIIRHLWSGLKTRADWLAMFMVLMSLSSLVLISAFRYNSGAFYSSPFFPRHNLEISLGLVGILYFLLKFINSWASKKMVGPIVGTFCVLTCTVLSFHHIEQIKKENTRTWYDKIENNQIKYYQTENPIETFKFRSVTCWAPAEDCIKAFALIEKHGLSEKRLREKTPEQKK